MKLELKVDGSLPESRSALSSDSREKTNYDSDTPPNLLQFMVKNWKKPGAVKGKVSYIENHRRRRETLSQRFPGNLLIIPTGHPKVRSNDTNYPFRAGTEFFYLTGNLEPDCVLVLAPNGKNHQHILFAEPNPGKTDATFFTDRKKGELWEGPRLGIEQSQLRYGVDRCLPLAYFAEFLAELAPANGVRVLRGFSSESEVLCTQKLKLAHNQSELDKELAVFLSEMRLIKDKDELKELSLAIASTHRGFEDVIRRLKTAKSERELEGVFYTRARTEGNDIGYGSIVAAGSHGCTLHWKKNDGPIRKGDLLLLDAGVEGRSLYTADITRTLPISGKFTKEQRAVYEIVLSAQTAAMSQVRPGNDFMDPNRAAMKVIAEGLERLGILPMSSEEALKTENQFYKRYSLHNVSHMLGLDVHDCAQARAENYKYGKLEAGMVLTVEPGLYFQPDDLTVPVKYRGIGIRIEDDVVVTEKGCKVLSNGIPKGVEEVEKWIQRCWSKK